MFRERLCKQWLSGCAVCAFAVLLMPKEVSAAAGLPGLFDTPWVGFDAGDYPTARYVYGGFTADFDNDGAMDIATCTWPSIPRVTVLLNHGDGTYAAPDMYGLSKGAFDMSGGDFDGDGFIDLVASNTGTNYEGTTISLLRNNQDGTFATTVEIATGGVAPVGLAPADYDMDGDLDLAVANWGFLGAGNTVSLLRNNGDGTFAPATVFPAGSAPYELTMADFDGDGLPDLAVANGTFNSQQAARINILYNDGAGGFESPQQLPTFWPSLMFFPAIKAADVDLDGDIDFAYSHTGLTTGGQYAVAVIKNLGGGSFASPVAVPTGLFTGGATSLDVADLTGDGLPDIVGTNLDNQSWIIMRGTGGGNFAAAQRIPSGEAPVHVRCGDVDLDDDVDVVVLSRDSLEVGIHINPGDGDFAPVTAAITDPFSQFSEHGDVDGDGDEDAVTSGVDIRIFRNDGDGTFAPNVIYDPVIDPLDVKLRDLDNDGDLDLVYNEETPPYRWASALNNGAGVFSPPTIWPVGTCGYFLFGEIDAFDLDNDNDLDIVRVEMAGCVGIPESSRRVFIDENLGGGVFQSHSILVVNPSPRSVAAADFNHDGNLDLVVTGQPTTILLGHGDLTFTQTDAQNMPGINVTTDDFDGDGNADIAIVVARLTSFLESTAVQLGNGDGTFQPAEFYLGSHAPDLGNTQRDIHSGDINQDGAPDLMVVNSASNDISVFVNNGDGSFQRQVRYGTNVHPADFEYADFTGDGIGDTLTLHLSFPPLGSGLTLTPGIGTAQALGDSDGDGDVDLVDFAAFQLCFSGPGGGLGAGCNAFDFDGDDDCDLSDFASFQLAFTGAL